MRDISRLGWGAVRGHRLVEVVLGGMVVVGVLTGSETKGSSFLKALTPRRANTTAGSAKAWEKCQYQMQCFHAFQLLIFIDVKTHHMCAQTGTHTYIQSYSLFLLWAQTGTHMYTFIFSIYLSICLLSPSLFHMHKNTQVISLPLARKWTLLLHLTSPIS